MKKLRILALLLVLVCLLAACSNKAEKKSRTDADKSVSDAEENTQPSEGIVGSWSGQADVTQKMAESLGGDTQLNGSLIFAFQLDLNEDGTAKMTLDKDATEAASAEFMQSLTDMMLEQIYQAAEQSGDTTREAIDAEFESQYGMTTHEYVESNFNFDTLLSGMGELNVDGVYRYTDGKLYIENTEAEIKDDTYMAVTLDGNTLTLDKYYENGVESDGTADSIGMLLPMTFTRN